MATLTITYTCPHCDKRHAHKAEDTENGRLEILKLALSLVDTGAPDDWQVYRIDGAIVTDETDSIAMALGVAIVMRIFS